MKDRNSMKIIVGLTFQTFKLSVHEMIALLFFLHLSNDFETSDQHRSPDNLLRNVVGAGET